MCLLAAGGRAVRGGLRGGIRQRDQRRFTQLEGARGRDPFAGLEALLALSSRQRYLALSVPGGIGVVPYVAIGTARLAAAFVVCHLAGRAYRDDLLRLFTRYLGVTPEALDAYHQALDRAEIVVIPFFVELV